MSTGRSALTMSTSRSRSLSGTCSAVGHGQRLALAELAFLLRRMSCASQINLLHVTQRQRVAVCADHPRAMLTPCLETRSCFCRWCWRQMCVVRVDVVDRALRLGIHGLYRVRSDLAPMQRPELPLDTTLVFLHGFLILSSLAIGRERSQSTTMLQLCIPFAFEIPTLTSLLCPARRWDCTSNFLRSFCAPQTELIR